MEETDLQKLGYKLIWQDEFDGSDVSRDDWNIEVHPDSWINGELQSYVDDGQHVVVEDGHLAIKPERVIAPDSSLSYKSARVNTKGKHDFTYGYVEVRAKVAKGKGFLSGMRLLPASEGYGEWPRSGEVDFVNVDGQYPFRGFSIMHFGVPVTQRNKSFEDEERDFSEDYHVFGCEWLPGKMTFYVDGKEHYTNSYWFSSLEEDGTRSFPAPFDRSFYIEFDVAIGGKWVGTPDRTTLFDESAELCVDYVRLYRKDEYKLDIEAPNAERNFREPDGEGNYISHDEKDWEFMIACSGEASCSYEDGCHTIDTINSGDAEYSVQLVQEGLPLIKGKKYRISFEAEASSRRTLMFAVTAPDIHWFRYLEDTKVEVGDNWQTHIFTFEMKDEDDDNGRIEFNLGNNPSTATVKIRNVRLEQVDTVPSRRRAIAVCGAWEDAENYNLFIESLSTPAVKEKYVVMSFTFGLSANDGSETETELQFADFISGFDMVAMFVFAEMIKNETILIRLRQIAYEKNIPVIFLEKEFDGVINAVLNYSGGFESMVNHILDHHGCKKVKMFAGFKGNQFSIERENIFKRLMLSHKLKVSPDDILYGNFWDAPTIRELNKRLDEGMKLPDAFVCANDSMAVGVCDCLKKRGIRVPEDVLVTGFDGAWHGRYHNPVITTTSPDYSGLEKYVLDVLDGKIPWENGKTVKIEVNFKDHIEGSCGCHIRKTEDWEEIVNTVSDDNQDYFRHMLEMGKFVTRTISMSDIDEASMDMEHYLWLWTNQYYFVGLTAGLEGNCVHSILHGQGGNYLFKEKFYNLAEPLPDYDDLVKPDSGYNILLFRQIRSVSTDYGYICSGFSHVSMRDQQRFEEFGLHVSAMVSSVLDKIQLLEANKAISRLSERDYLTNLYNRRGFFRCVNDMLKDPNNRGRIFSLFSIDMDGLKYINDHYGHQEGDNAIIILARSLASYAGERGVCARYGGDEFAMAIVGDINIADDYINIRERIRGHAMADPIVRDLGYSVNASIGIAECVITGNDDIEELIRNADLRMYEDKQARKGSNEIR
ncbi:MAG: diguanylate cyclase [Clostridiales bacterium]|nr:diguanylate cyclase [Clostridiales bacterium]